MQQIVAEGSLLLAMLIALAAGLLSFFSPCVLPLVPGYLAYLSGSAAPSLTPRQLRSRLLFATALFITGFSAVFLAFFALAGTVGLWLNAYQTQILQVSGAVIIFLGLLFCGVFPKLQKVYKLQQKPATGVSGALFLGFVFALGWTPCIGPTLSVILALSLQEATVARALLLGVCYCLGLGLPFLGMTSGLGAVTQLSTWVRKRLRTVNLAGGILLILLGVLMLTGAWTQLLGLLQTWLSGFVTVL